MFVLASHIIFHWRFDFLTFHSFIKILHRFPLFSLCSVNRRISEKTFFRYSSTDVMNAWILTRWTFSPFSRESNGWQKGILTLWHNRNTNNIGNSPVICSALLPTYPFMYVNKETSKQTVWNQKVSRLSCIQRDFGGFNRNRQLFLPRKKSWNQCWAGKLYQYQNQYPKCEDNQAREIKKSIVKAEFLVEGREKVPNMLVLWYSRFLELNSVCFYHLLRVIIHRASLCY